MLAYPKGNGILPLRKDQEKRKKEFCKITPLIMGLVCTHELLLLCIDSSTGLNGFCRVL